MRKVLCILAFTIASANATNLHVFAVGNSLTDGLRWMPNWIGGGIFDYMNSSVTNQFSGSKASFAGAPLGYTWNQQTNSYQALTNSGWDVLVIQPYQWMMYDNLYPANTNHTYDWGDITNSVNFIKFALTANPNIQIYIYSHWPGAPTNYQRHAQIMAYTNKATSNLYTWAEADAYRRSALSNFNFDVSWDALYTNLNGYVNIRTRSYFELLVRELEKQNVTNLAHEIRLIPAGDVLYALNQKMKNGECPGYTNISQIYQDVPHLRPGIGRLIMAATWYATLFEKSPEGLNYSVYNVVSNSLAATNLYGSLDTPYYVEISPQFAALVQSTAWEVVRSHPFAGIAPLDYDKDSLPNSWEKQYFGTTTNASPDAACSNGINTVREAYIAGLNPLGTNSFRMQTNGDVFNWNTASGRVYDIHFTTNLLNGFTPLYTNIPWTANSLTHPAEGFYRLKVRLP